MHPRPESPDRREPAAHPEAAVEVPPQRGQISGELDLAEYNASKHLKVLTQAVLLEFQKEGREHRYAIPCEFDDRLNPGDGVLDLGCGAFRFDLLPK